MVPDNQDDNWERWQKKKNNGADVSIQSETTDLSMIPPKRHSPETKIDRPPTKDP